MVESLDKIKQMFCFIINHIIKDKLLLSLIAIFFLLLIFTPNFVILFPYMIDFNTISLIVFYIVLARGFIVSGLIDNMAIKAIEILDNTFKLYLFITLITMFVSILATNDGAVLIMTPLALSISRIINEKPEKYVVAILLSANTGSMIFPFSNPQNIIIWQHYKLSFRAIISITIPLTTLLTAILTMYIIVTEYPKRRSIDRNMVLPKIKTRKTLSSVLILLLILGALLGELHLGLLALFVETIIICLIDWRIYRGIDYNLIIIFFLMFPIFNEVAIFMKEIHGFMLSGTLLYIISIALSQAISNVPTTIALINYTLDWKTLLIGVNIAGYITPIGSLANIIGLRISHLSFIEYFKISYKFTMLSFILGVLLIFIL